MLHSLNLRTRKRRVLYWKQVEGLRRRHQATVQRFILTAYASQLNQIVSAAERARTRDQVVESAVSAVPETEAFYREAIEKSWKRVVSSAGMRYWEALEKDLHPRVDEDFFIHEAIQEVERNGGKLIQAPTATTQRRVQVAAQAAVADGIERGWGIDRIARQLQRNASETVFPPSRAENVARTETARAVNHAAQVVGEASNLNLGKEWIDTPDDRTRASHSEAGGQIVRINKLFVVGGYECRYPADAMLPISEAARCRCTMAHVTL